MTYPFERCTCSHVRATHAVGHGSCTGCECSGFRAVGDTALVGSSIQPFTPEVMRPNEAAFREWLTLHPNIVGDFESPEEYAHEAWICATSWVLNQIQATIKEARFL